MKNIKSFFKKLSKKMSTWPTEQPKWNTECINVLLDSSKSRPEKPEPNLNIISKKSRDFPIKFPIITMTCQSITPSAGKEIIERNIKSVYPIIHEHSLYLCAKFLLFKQTHGSDIEKKYYQNTTVKDLIHRILTKRAITFMDSSDSYLLLDGTQGYNNWTTIGKNHEKPPLIFKNYLSYDEIKLSALLSVSSYTYFINDGNRFNKGVVEENRLKLEQEGIIIGLIGTRFEKECVMEYEEMIISRNQNTESRGYGNSEKPSLQKVFAEFYEQPSFTYNDERVTKDKRFVKLEDGLYFDNYAYVKRLALSFDTLLLEANFRAKEKSTSAYIHVVGIGLGVWKISSHQTVLFLDAFVNRLSFLGKQLPNVSDVHFAYISATNYTRYKNGDILSIPDHPNGGIKIHISKREPFTKLPEQGKLLVVSYAWDGNAMPGNEFWIGMLAATGDCAAAASTQIAELHNPHINDLVCGDNVMVASIDGSVVSIYEYVERLKCN